MNCNPGDIAIQVRAMVPSNVGRIVTVLDEGYQHEEHGWCWLTDGYVEHQTTCGMFRMAYSPDADLRPIRPQADDAKDETLQWLPVPSRETESA